jgi:hypothetical protein
MHTLQPEAFINKAVPCEFSSKNAPLGRYGTRKKAVLTPDQYVEDFIAYVLLFEPFRIPQTKRLMHSLSGIAFHSSEPRQFLWRPGEQK